MEKNAEQKQAVAHISYQENLVYWLLDMHITRAASDSIDRRRERSADEYWNLLDKKCAEFIEDYDWVGNLGSVMPQEYFDFTEEQKQSLKEYLDLFYNDLPFWEYGFSCFMPYTSQI